MRGWVTCVWGVLVVFMCYSVSLCGGFLFDVGLTWF